MSARSKARRRARRARQFFPVRERPDLYASPRASTTVAPGSSWADKLQTEPLTIELLERVRRQLLTYGMLLDRDWTYPYSTSNVLGIAHRVAPNVVLEIKTCPEAATMTVDVYAGPNHEPVDEQTLWLLRGALQHELPIALYLDVRTSRCTVCQDCRDATAAGVPELAEACWRSDYGRKLRGEKAA